MDCSWNFCNCIWFFLFADIFNPHFKITVTNQSIKPINNIHLRSVGEGPVHQLYLEGEEIEFPVKMDAEIGFFNPLMFEFKLEFEDGTKIERMIDASSTRLIHKYEIQNDKLKVATYTH